MNADAYFTIGAGHAVCEDYALAGPIGPERVAGIVCDGCSSSPDTDVGARLVALCSLREMRRGALDIDAALRRADLMRRSLGLPNTALDATLLTIDATPAGARVRVWGDGVVAARHRNGRLLTQRIAYASGAPRYPSYRLARDRLAAYESADLGRGGPGGDGISLFFSADAFDLVLVGSDGLDAVRGASLGEVVEAVTDLRTGRGSFVQRRCRRFTRGCGELGDDFAVAAVRLP